MADKLEANVPVGVKITALDANKQLITAVNFPDSIIFTATNAGTFSPSVLTSTDFKSGIAQIIYTPAETGLAKIKVQAGALVGETEQRTVIETKQIFPDVSVTHPNYQAINFLKQKSIINGYGDGTFQPERFVSRAEMLKIILLAAKKTIDLSKLSNFPDVARSSWYSPYVQSAKDYKVVQGYSDGTFKPDKTVSLAECLKIALETLQVSMSVPTTNPYPDVLIDEWFSKYATYAKEHNLLDKELFEGAKEMKRADVAEIIYRLLK
ncbi:MAG: S-layer homology domain-containing protein [Patescibacteria group bacterium]|nr:S-layer homology domain-containing protein [Patescibacteria group bacterium]